MIDNDKQYEVTKKQVEDFREALKQMRGDKLIVHPILRAAHIAALTSQIEEMEFHMRVYDMHRGDNG